MFGDLGLVGTALVLLAILMALLAGGAVDRARAPRRRLCRDDDRRRTCRSAPCSRRPSGQARPRGRSPRCRCSSGWARSCSAPASPSRCSAASRPGCNGCPGRLMHVNVVGCGIFAAVSGSSAATCATIGKIALPELEKRGYDKGMSLGSARRLRHARAAHPAVDPDGGLCRRGERLGDPGLPRRLPARALLVMALYSGYIIVWSLAEPGEDAAAPTRP